VSSASSHRDDSESSATSESAKTNFGSKI
jgi:hypothetical protein